MTSNKPTPAGRRAERTLREAVADVLEHNGSIGLPVAVMKNGKAVLISVKEAIAAGSKEQRMRRSGRMIRQ